MNTSEIRKVLELHRKWLCGEKGGVKAILSGAILSGADLRGARLRGAVLRWANLQNADLSYADLEGADLRGADLRWAFLSVADLQNADLQSAFLSGADLRGADLLGADLLGADLSGADLSGADLPDFQLPAGELIGYKKVRDGVILTLKISKERTASLTTNKCRCRSAKVLSANTEGTEFRSIHDPNFIYRVGETVTVENWSDDIRIECAEGIHFFRTFEEAQNYGCFGPFPGPPRS